MENIVGNLIKYSYLVSFISKCISNERFVVKLVLIIETERCNDQFLLSFKYFNKRTSFLRRSFNIRREDFLFLLRSIERYF